MALGSVRTGRLRFGDSATATNNFYAEPDGSGGLNIYRGNPGSAVRVATFGTGRVHGRWSTAGTSSSFVVVTTSVPGLNTTTGVFTVQTAGLYLLTTSLTGNDTGRQLQSLLINGLAPTGFASSEWMDVGVVGASTSFGYGNSVVLSLSVGDTVNFQSTTSGANTFHNTATLL